MDDFALELVLQARNLGPLEVVENTSGMEQEIAMILEFSGLLTRFALSEFDCPLPLLVVPIRTNDFGVKCHVLSKIERFADLVQVLPDISSVREELWPV